jgi:anti-sigma B factor antagonist
MAPQEAPPAVSGIAVDFPRPGLAVVTLVGEHDISLQRRLREALATASIRPNLLVDLSACTFMDSTVIGMLLLARNRLAARGGRLELFIPPEATAARRVAELTMLDSLLSIHQAHAQAVRSLRLTRCDGHETFPVLPGLDGHATAIRDLRQRFGAPEVYAASCSCGWRGEPCRGHAAERTARRTAVVHIDEWRCETAQRAKPAALELDAYRATH